MNNSSKKKINVFLIDDSDVDSFLTKNRLDEIESINIIRHFKSSSAALEYIIADENQETLPELILLDIEMPIIDGFEFLDELEESNKFPDEYPFKVVLLTNSNKVRDREKFQRENNAVQFIQKPIVKPDFEALLVELFKL